MLPAGEVSFHQRVRASAPAGVAPEPPGDSGRIIWRVFHVTSGGSFVLLAGAHERTHGCSPRAPGRFGQNRLGGFVSGQF